MTTASLWVWKFCRWVQVDNPNLVTFMVLGALCLSARYVIWCGSKGNLLDYMFKILKSIRVCSIGSQVHILGGFVSWRDHLMSTIIFILIMIKMFIWDLKIMRKVVVTSSWVLLTVSYKILVCLKSKEKWASLKINHFKRIYLKHITCASNVIWNKVYIFLNFM